MRLCCWAVLSGLHTCNAVLIVVLAVLALEARVSVAGGDDGGAAIWDFIVVGAGTGGSLCAARLAESGASVLLVEAGGWDQPEHYVMNAERQKPGMVWAYPAQLPSPVHMQNSKEFRHNVMAGKGLGGSSQVHGDVYNRPSFRELDYFGLHLWDEATVRAAFERIEADLVLEWAGEADVNDMPDGVLHVFEMMLTNFTVPYRPRPHIHNDGAVAGISAGWWKFRTCPPGTPLGKGPGCRRQTSYSNLVANRNESGDSSMTVLPDTIAARILFEEREAVGVELLRNGRTHEAFARRAVVLAAGAVGTPRLLTLSGIGDPLELQRLGVPVRHANREVGQGLADHLATFGWFMVRGDESLLLEGPLCDDVERFHAFFNLTGEQSGDGKADAEIRVFSGCNLTRGTVDFFMEAVLLHPLSRGRVVVTSRNPEMTPRIEFPTLWEKDFEQLEAMMGRVADSLGLVHEDVAADFGMSLSDSVRKHSYLYQHLCCSARIAVDGSGVLDERLRVIGTGGLYVADTSALPTTVSSHTAAAALLVAEMAASDAIHALPRPLPSRAESTSRDAMLSSTGSASASDWRAPTVRLPSRPSAGVEMSDFLELPLAGVGTGTMAKHRVADAVASFLQLGGRLLDTAAMYTNYAEIRAGIEAIGARDLSDLMIVDKYMPLGREHVLAGVASALEGLGRPYVELALLHWPGDISSGKLLHGKPLPPCAEPFDGGVSWRRCRSESYAALLEERVAGRVRAIGVSNFAARHLDELEEEGFPLPAAHQLELHPLWPDDEMLERHRRDGTKVMAYGCLGGKHTGAALLRNKAFQKIATRRNVTVAQLLLRWSVERGASVIAGGSSESHLAQNLQVFGFELLDDETDFLGSIPFENVRKMYGPLPEEIL